MPTCEAKTAGGVKCGISATDQSYFWYFDPYDRINRVFRLCQEHSNQIINTLIQKETGITHLIDKLKKKIEHTKNLKHKSSNFTEQREAIKTAKENGVAPPTFPSMQKLDEEISELYRKIGVYYNLRNIERNKTCRYANCRYPLKEPHDNTDQIGNAFAHADFHSGNGYRREVIMFHTECGISWALATVQLVAKELKYIRPQLTGQTQL